MSFAWNTNNITEVATLLKQGLSAAQIGAQLGISRNAVIGKVGRDESLRRVGFAWTRAQPFAGKHPERLKAVRTLNFKSDKPTRTRRPAVALVAPDPEYTVAKPMLLLGARDCRWPINDADQDELHLFCSATTESGKSFCPHHHHRAFDHRRSADV